MSSFRPCSHCGTPRRIGRSSAAQVVCQPCRRIAHGLRPDQFVSKSKSKARGDCHRCGAPVPGGTKRWKYCTDACFRKARSARGNGGPTLSASDRGYGRAHQMLRLSLLPGAIGSPCHFCAVAMQEGDDLHLDHTEDRSGYRGIVHAACNVADGARRGGEAFRRKRLAEGWRVGQDPSTRRRPQAAAS